MLYSVTAAALTVLMASAAVAKGSPPGKGETTLGNNLSVPATFVPSSTAAGAPALRLPCVLNSEAPTSADPQCTDFPGYWCQKTAATWQAACTAAAATASLTADWGDNPTGVAF
jgi:hypothetical protein